MKYEDCVTQSTTEFVELKIVVRGEKAFSIGQAVQAFFYGVLEYAPETTWGDNYFDCKVLVPQAKRMAFENYWREVFETVS